MADRTETIATDPVMVGGTSAGRMTAIATGAAKGRAIGSSSGCRRTARSISARIWETGTIRGTDGATIASSLVADRMVAMAAATSVAAVTNGCGVAAAASR